jgi:Tfp pilus assembly protein PilZ
VAARLKPVLKRPWLHHLIIICYIGAPIANILLLKVFLHVSFKIIFSNLAAGYGILATIWLLTAPIVGISLYFVKKFSWYVFLGHSGIILLDFIVKWATRPAYYLRTVPGFHNIILLAGNIALVAIVTYIIQRDFRSPYLQILNRSWRERSRIPVYHTISLDGQPRTMNDLSTGGCFVLESGFQRAAGARVRVSFESNTLNVDCMGEIMRVTETGLGIRFVRLPAGKKRDIRRMLKNRFALRQKVDIPCTWAFQDEVSEARLVDLNNGGCYVQAQVGGLREDSAGNLMVLLPEGKNTYSLPGRVVWINRSGAHEKPVGFGFRFDRRQAHFMRDATVHYGRGMLVR